MPAIEIAIIGLGGVGGYFGFKLAQTYHKVEDVNINFVVRQETFAVIKKRGLTLLSPEHPDNVIKPDVLVKNFSELPQVDLALICVKAYDLENVCLQLKRTISASTVILPLLNGVDVYNKIKEILPKNIILPACVYVASHIKEKGTVEHKGMPGRIIFGKDPQIPKHTPKEVVKLLKNANIQIDYIKDPFPEIWTKFIFIASFGLVTARYNQTIGQVQDDSKLYQIALSIMMEIKAIAEKYGVFLPYNIIDLTFDKAASFPYYTPTSLQLDIHAKKPHNELELLAGAIIKYGEELGIPVPATRKIYKEIKGCSCEDN